MPSYEPTRVSASRGREGSEPMSTDADRQYIRRALRQDPDEFLAKHRDELRALRDRTDNEQAAAVIDAVLADLEDQEGWS